MRGREKAYELARQFVIQSHQKTSAQGSLGFTAAERAGGALLAAVAAELALISQDRRELFILIDRPPNRFGVQGNVFVRVVADVVTIPVMPAELLRFEPNLRAILEEVGIALIGMNRPAATAVAMFVRDVRNVLDADAELASPPMPWITQPRSRTGRRCTTLT
ncbi:MAG TPA: hypothetical protein VNO21_07890 [Polyangiaceae bacterium]|nr:hypothetical protein [Polyangiaceae bacterium]